jgi:hypothetical protein
MTDSPPPPPGWYADPRDQRVQRYWNGYLWTDDVADVTALLPPASSAPSARMPRSGLARSAIAYLIFTAYVIPLVGVMSFVGDRAGMSFAVRAGCAALWSLPFVLAGRLVSLSWWQAMFTPTWKVAWRVAYLPFRDWPPRPDEAAGWLQVRHPTEPGALLYVKAKGRS